MIGTTTGYAKGRGPKRWVACVGYAREFVMLLGLLLALAGCAQAPGCNLVKVAEVPLQPARGRLFTVPVTINGHNLDMLLDTGASKSMLVDASVRRFGIRQDGRTVTILVGLNGGSLRADANIDSISLGDAPLSVDRMSVNSFNGSGIDGVLGLDVLKEFDLDIDAPHKTLALYRVRRCDTADPPWSEPAVRIAGTSSVGDWLAMPIEIDGVQGSAIVDTGASYTIVTPRMRRRLGLTEQQLANDRTVTQHVVAGEDSTASIHRFGTIRVGPVAAHNVSILVLTKDPPALAGGRRFSDAMIGQDMLRNRRVWFSFSTGQLYLSRTGGDNAGAD
jgi:predicted aspartyl protease